MSVNGSINQAGNNPCTDLIPYVPAEQALGLPAQNKPVCSNPSDLLEIEGRSLPNIIQELCVSYLDYFAPQGEASIDSLCQRTQGACGDHLGNINALRRQFNAPVPSPLLEIEGNPLPNKLQELAVSYLPFNGEVVAEPGTVEQLCRRTQEASQHHLENIAAIRQGCDPRLVIANDLGLNDRGTPVIGLQAYRRYLSNEHALRLCKPNTLIVADESYSDLELVDFFEKNKGQFNQLQSLLIRGHLPERIMRQHLKITDLPALEYLQISDPNLRTAVVRNVPKLQTVLFSGDYTRGQPLTIDVRESKCQVEVMRHCKDITILSTDGQGKEVQVTGRGDLRFSFPKT